MGVKRIYLDHAATTPMLLEVRQAMEPYLGTAFGNPSSLYAEGQLARRALDTARDTIAGALGAEFAEITFTSGGTEADNAALVGIMLAHRHKGNHLVTTQIEHEAVLRSACFLETLGFEVTYLAPDSEGLVHPEQVADAFSDQTVLVSVMHANNEVGTIQPVRAIADLVHARGGLLHTDAVQTFGQCPVSVTELGADLLSVSAHKIGGPKGIGALRVRSGLPIEPWLHGGTQERERRAGTENVAGIVGFAEAVRGMVLERDALAIRLTCLRDLLLSELLSRIPSAVLNGHPTERLPNNVNVSFPGLDAESLLVSLDMAGLSASSGSACTSGSIEPSHVLQAMGLPAARIGSAIRLTLGRETSEENIHDAVAVITEIVSRQWSSARN